MKRINVYACFLIFLLFLQFSLAETATVKKKGEIYEISLTGIGASESGDFSKTDLSGNLLIFFSDNDAEPPEARIEIRKPPGVDFVKIQKSHLPPQFEGIFGDREFFLFNVRNTAAPDEENIILELKDPYKNEAMKDIPETLTILDPFGNPATGFEARILHRNYHHESGEEDIVLFEKIIGEDGALQIPWPVDARNPYLPERSLHPQNLRMKLIVRDPETGQAQRFDYPWKIHRNGRWQYEDEIYLSIPARDYSADEVNGNIFHGKVLEPGGNPVKKGLVVICSVQIPSGDQYFRNAGDGNIFLDDSAQFKFAIPLNWLEDLTGSRIFPEETSVRIVAKVEHDSRQNLAEVIKNVHCGKENIITLKEAEWLRFRFKDETGAIIENPFKNYHPSHLILEKVEAEKTLNRHFSQKTYTVRKEDDNAILVGPVPLPATYKVYFKEKEYKPQRLEKNASENDIVWEPVKQGGIYYTGYVKDIRTGAPISGAYVFMTRCADTNWNLVNMNQQDRDMIWEGVKPGEAPRIIEQYSMKLSNGRPLIDIYSVALTDKNGRYKVYFPPLIEVGTVNVWKPGMICMEARGDRFKSQEDESRLIKVPDVGLMPTSILTAKITPPIAVPDRYLRENEKKAPESLYFGTSIVINENPGWQMETPLLNATDERPWQPVYTRGWNYVNREFKVHIPAEAVFNLSFSNGNDPTIAGVFFRELGPYKPGEEERLEEREMALKQPYMIKVLNPDGTAAPGVAVRIEGHIPELTDEDGIVFGWTRGTVSRIEVLGDDRSIMTKKEDVTIPDNDPEYIVTLSLPE